MAVVTVTNEVSIEAFEAMDVAPDLSWDDSDLTADGQATREVDVWLWEYGATAREGNQYGQRLWYSFTTRSEARQWFAEVTNP